MAKGIRAQSYIRIEDENDRYCGFLDDSLLVPHNKRIDHNVLKSLVISAIDYANKKSSRQLLEIPEEISNDKLEAFYKKKGKDLFKYFVRYCGDPASTAFDCLNKHYAQIAKENFRNNTLQKERMNSGWRYQHLAKDTARLSERFDTISDLNSKEADFNAIISYKDTFDKLSIYVSVKNRSNTMGGQDWPKAIYALEAAAINDKNRNGSYICVFGIAMEKGTRYIKKSKETKQPLSVNTEVWLSDFFWPFFSNFSYNEISKAVLQVLVEDGRLSSLDAEIPTSVIESFGDECRSLNLLDNDGKFNNAQILVDLFTGNL